MVNLSLIKSKYLIEQLDYVDERENEREPRCLIQPPWSQYRLEPPITRGTMATSPEERERRGGEDVT